MATITVKGANCTSFSGGTEQASTSCVGTTWDGNTIQTVVCRYKFTTNAYGATSFTFKTTRGYCDVRGSSSSDDQIGRMRFAIGTSATQYKTTKSSSVGTAITDYRYGGSGTGYVAGSSSTKLLPNTTYYLWVFPNANFASYVRFGIGNCTITTSGTYGTASTISANNGTFGSNIPVTLTNSVSGTTNTLTVTCGGITKTLINNTTAMSATWTPSLSEYGAAITNAKSATATFTVTTKYGSATWGTNTKTITVTFPSSAGPSISNVAIDYDNTASAALSAFTVFVQGYSKARATITASGQYSATISTYALTINGVTVSGGSNIQTSASVTTSGTVTATIKVTDSRGFTATTTQDFTVQPYSNPSLTGVDLHRSNSSGTAAEDGEYLYAYGVGNISSLSGQNTLTMSVAFKTTTGSYGTETPMTSDTAVVVSGLDPDVTYVARITLTDRLGNSTTVQAAINSQKWAMKFNATATAVGFGKAPESNNVLEIPNEWSIVKGVGSSQQHAIFSGGDTMTGDLYITKESSSEFRAKCSTIDAKIGQTIPQSSVTLGSFTVEGMHGACAWDNVQKTSADMLVRSIYLTRKKADDTSAGNGFQLAIDSSGNSSVSFQGGGKSAWRSALGIAGMADGLKIKYGSGTTNSSGQLKVTFSGATFTSTPVVVVSAHGSSTSSVYDARPASTTTSGFTVYCTKQSGSTTSVGSSAPIRWIAIGV